MTKKDNWDKFAIISQFCVGLLLVFFTFFIAFDGLPRIRTEIQTGLEDLKFPKNLLGEINQEIQTITKNVRGCSNMTALGTATDNPSIICLDDGNFTFIPWCYESDNVEPCRGNSSKLIERCYFYEYQNLSHLFKWG